MKWALIVVGILAGLVLLVAIIGAALPRDHVATMSATIGAPPDKVWAALTDVASYPSWRSDVRTVDVLSAAPLSWKEHGSQGEMTFAVEVFNPPREMTARIQDKGLPFGGAWEYRVAPASDPSRSVVTITERGWVSNPIFRFVSRFVMGHHATLDMYLRALGRKFGEEIAPVRA